jgi:hypothetical protein
LLFALSLVGLHFRCTVVMIVNRARFKWLHSRHGFSRVGANVCIRGRTAETTLPPCGTLVLWHALA